MDYFLYGQRNRLEEDLNLQDELSDTLLAVMLSSNDDYFAGLWWSALRRTLHALVAECDYISFCGMDRGLLLACDPSISELVSDYFPSACAPMPDEDEQDENEAA